MSPERAPWRAGVAVAGAVLVIGTLTLHRHLVGVFYDDGLYAGLATALARGDGYVHPHLPGMPTAVHYPPLYPVVLAPLFGLLSVETAALGGWILNLLLGAGAAGLAARHAVRHRLLGDDVPAWIPAAFASRYRPPGGTSVLAVQVAFRVTVPPEDVTYTSSTERAAAIAKAHICERAQQAARDAVEAHGGIGFTWECDVQLWFKRILFDRQWLGTPEEHRERVAQMSNW